MCVRVMRGRVRTRISPALLLGEGWGEGTRVFVNRNGDRLIIEMGAILATPLEG